MKGDLDVLASYLGISVEKLTTEANTPVLTVNSQKKYCGLITIARYLANLSKRSELLGKTPEAQAEVNQWLEYRTVYVDRCSEKKEVEQILEELNKHLSDKVFFVENRLSLADILLYLGLHCIFSQLTFFEKQKYLNVSRWFDHVQHLDGSEQLKKQKLFFQRNLIYTGSAH